MLLALTEGKAGNREFFSMMKCGIAGIATIFIPTSPASILTFYRYI